MNTLTTNCNLLSVVREIALYLNSNFKLASSVDFVIKEAFVSTNGKTGRILMR